MNKHKVSIIVPIYNVGKYIERCVVSLFEQDFEDIEYIFVNDCTSDSSVEILEKIIEKYPNRKPNCKIIHHKENKGSGATRRTGIENAIGEYTLQIDSDDWCELNMISSLYSKAKETDADMVVCDHFVNFSKIETYSKQNFSENHSANLRNLLISNGLYNHFWNKFIKRNLYDRYNVYPPTEISFGEDKWVIIRLFSQKIKVTYLPKAFVHYWQENKKSLSQNVVNKTFEDVKWYAETTEQFLRQQGIFELYQDAFYTGVLKTILWLSKGKYHRKRINYICPQANKLKYITKFVVIKMMMIHSLQNYSFVHKWLLKLKVLLKGKTN